MIAPRQTTAATRRGLVLVVVLLLLPVLFGFTGLVVDVGYLYTTKAWLQGVADNAVLTGLAAADLSTSYAQEDAKVREVVAATASANGLSSTLFTVVTVKHPSSDDVLVARASGRVRAPLFFACLLGMTEAEIGLFAVAEAILSGNSTRGGNIAVFGFTGVTAGGGVFIDSYDSRDGPYMALSTGPDGKPYAKANALLAGNGDMETNGDISFHGDAYFGHDIDIVGASGFVLGAGYATNEIDAPPTAFLYGENYPYPVPTFYLPPADYPADIATNNDNASITGYFDGPALANNSWLVKGTGIAPRIIYIPAGGKYYFNGIDLPSQVQVILSGDPSLAGKTMIYMNGPATVLGGIFNGGSNPSALDLRIVSINTTPGAGTIKLGGNSALYVDVYAPEQTFVLVGGTTLYGRIVGDVVDLQGNSTIHYDEALEANSGGAVPGGNRRRFPHLTA